MRAPPLCWRRPTFDRKSDKDAEVCFGTRPLAPSPTVGAVMILVVRHNLVCARHDHWLAGQEQQFGRDGRQFTRRTKSKLLSGHQRHVTIRDPHPGERLEHFRPAVLDDHETRRHGRWILPEFIPAGLGPAYNTASSASAVDWSWPKSDRAMNLSRVAVTVLTK